MKRKMQQVLFLHVVVNWCSGLEGKEQRGRGGERERERVCVRERDSWANFILSTGISRERVCAGREEPFRRLIAILHLSVASLCTCLLSSRAFLCLSSSACAIALFFCSRALRSWVLRITCTFDSIHAHITQWIDTEHNYLHNLKATYMYMYNKSWTWVSDAVMHILWTLLKSKDAGRW